LVTGSADTGFPVTAGAYDVSYNGDISDVFVARAALTSNVSGVAPGAPPDPFALTVFPNPVSDAARIAFTLPGFAPAPEVEILDAAGRLCARLRLGPLAAGPQSIDWTALDRSGRPLPSGVYAVRVTAGDWVRSQRIVLLR
jgi:hypothetical protein